MSPATHGQCVGPQRWRRFCGPARRIHLFAPPAHGFSQILRHRHSCSYHADAHTNLAAPALLNESDIVNCHQVTAGADRGDRLAAPGAAKRAWILGSSPSPRPTTIRSPAWPTIPCSPVRRGSSGTRGPSRDLRPAPAGPALPGDRQARLRPYPAEPLPDQGTIGFSGTEPSLPQRGQHHCVRVWGRWNCHSLTPYWRPMQAGHHLAVCQVFNEKEIRTAGP